MAQFVYRFAEGQADGDAARRDLLGGKGANLAEMCNLGLPVPPGFTITTEVCTAYYREGRAFPEGLATQVDSAIRDLGDRLGKRFGDPAAPLLVSVRSGARASMPGMMDTVLNLGLNDATVEGLARASGDGRFAWDSYRRFIQMYSDVVLGVDHHTLEELLDDVKDAKGYSLDTELEEADWRAVVAAYRAKVEEETGKPFPQDPGEQLWGAIRAVFDSWMNDRAKTYRRLHAIPESWGTAVNVQAMVFGNMGATSATGVAFTRDPATGDNRLYGEFLINAQGEDVVAGIRTPQPLTREGARGQEVSMEEAMPQAFAALVAAMRRLEGHYRDMQDIEFTVEQDRLFMLQTRAGKRTARAALKIACDMVREGLIDPKAAVARVDAGALDQLLHPTLDPKAPRTLYVTGLPASPGAACGEVVFDAGEAERLAGEGHDVILVRTETSPDDIRGMHAAKGILTARGGMTSHAAVVARGWGLPCVSGASGLRIDERNREMIAGGRTIRAGETITLDGATGQVFLGRVAMIEPELTGDFAELMVWADQMRRMKVRTNAETPADAEAARRFGAEGIGLCRTEHMFFDADRIVAVREMILADTPEGRRRPLERLLPMQRGDFAAIFAAMSGLPVTIRLLDPPLHEFLPHDDDDIAEIARESGLPPEKLRIRTNALREANPMLGHRGCRLGITFPEIYEMQVRAIFEAAHDAAAKTGEPVRLEIMIPLVATKAETEILGSLVDRIAGAVAAERGRTQAYIVGTMIELPRAALRAGEIAERAQFFSFGTNDLTQTTFGLSRDDVGTFLPDYLTRGILETDPFISIDRDGVGELVRIAAERGRAVRSDLKLGICGEHGGDPASIAFCEEIGLDYVSCSPYRVPIARLAAAQAAIAARRDD